MTKKNKISVRLTPYQMQCLDELTQAMETSYSMLIRTIVGDWLNQHEDQLERIIAEKLNNDGTVETN